MEGALDKNCATFKQKKAAQVYLDSEQEKCNNPHNAFMRMDHQLRGKQLEKYSETLCNN